MDIAQKPETGDLTIEQGGIRIFVQTKADNMLANVTMDYSDIQGFIFTGMSQSSCRG
jgi:Fe-S cluster assembly iron-binding protein IscA